MSTQKQYIVQPKNKKEQMPKQTKMKKINYKHEAEFVFRDGLDLVQFLDMGFEE
jgi:hypothetical protein